MLTGEVRQIVGDPFARAVRRAEFFAQLNGQALQLTDVTRTDAVLQTGGDVLRRSDFIEGMKRTNAGQRRAQRRTKELGHLQ